MGCSVGWWPRRIRSFVSNLYMNGRCVSESWLDSVGFYINLSRIINLFKVAKFNRIRSSSKWTLQLFALGSISGLKLKGIYTESTWRMETKKSAYTNKKLAHSLSTWKNCSDYKHSSTEQQSPSSLLYAVQQRHPSVSGCGGGGGGSVRLEQAAWPKFRAWLTKKTIKPAVCEHNELVHN